MERRTTFIGFGEAGRTFAGARSRDVPACAFDLKTADAATRQAMLTAYDTADVDTAETLAEAVQGAAVIFSLVTADQALAAAEATAKLIEPGTLFLDMNSVAPDTKRAAAKAIEAAGGHYVDVAVMAQVDPARLAVPLLVGGPHADAAVTALTAFGFTKARALGGEVGAASSVKMIRSVIVKGLEALTAECMLAAQVAGVRNEVIASLDASEKAIGWEARADYNLDRMLVHGLRRAAEMEEVVKTLDALGTGAAMTRGTVERQRALGQVGIAPPQGLDAKLAAITPAREDQAA